MAEYKRIGVDEDSKFPPRVEQRLYRDFGGAVPPEGLFHNTKFTGTITGLTKAMVGLNNVNNTADLNKPVSNATKTALDLKADQSALALKADLTQVIPANLPRTADLNDLPDGPLHQGANAGASLALNYPIAAAGLLQQRTVGVMKYQTYHSYAGTGRMFFRSHYDYQGAGPDMWKEVASGKTMKGRIAFGNDALANLDDGFSAGSNATIVAIGRGAMGRMQQVAQAIAIGSNAQGESLMSRDNISIGDSSLRNIQSQTPWYDQAKKSGTRNIAIGGNAMIFLKDGYGNVAIGRNASQCQVDGYGAVMIGSGAAGGNAPIGFSGQIENLSPWGTSGVSAVTLVGANTAEKNLSENITAVGSYALQQSKRSRFNTAVGVQALKNLDLNTGPNGGTATNFTKTGTYRQSGTTLTLTITGHTLAVGDFVRVRLTTGDSMTFANDQVTAKVLTVPNANAFTIQHTDSRTADGEAIIYGKETAAQQEQNEHNTVVGAHSAQEMTTGGWNAFLGSNVGRDMSRATICTMAGYNAGLRLASGARATLMGGSALVNATNNAASVTAIGASALSLNVDGTNATTAWANSTGLGYDSRVSGANQVQLGNSETTVYVHGTVQNRSDARDKADVRDTVLGLDFIEALRPVDFRWDMRDDYIERDEEDNVTVLEKDGSKKRQRYHHGFIAQEVQQLIAETGQDFGGLQDHTVTGGADVLSIGYDEVIAPLVKAIQELTARVRELESNQEES